VLADVMAEATGGGEGEAVPIVPGVHAIEAELAASRQ